MQELLIRKLYAHISRHNPQLLLELQQTNSVTGWLVKKAEAIDPDIELLIAHATPGYETEEQCMAMLIESLEEEKKVNEEN